ncbi:MAG: hypothetical protein ACE5KM_08965, partial [Planctomycetaceae bacterium]
VELAGIHHNPTPGPSGSDFLYGHVWVTISWLVTHPLVELWSWRRSGTTLRQRSDRPWDEPSRRPSHADRFKTLRKQVLHESFSKLPRPQRAKRKIQTLFKALARLVI